MLIPILNIYLDPLVETQRSGPSVNLPLQYGTINCLLHADNIFLIAQSAIDLKRLLAIAEVDSVNRVYNFSPYKCVCHTWEIHTSSHSVPLEWENSFCYLGIELNGSGICKLGYDRCLFKIKYVGLCVWLCSV